MIKYKIAQYLLLFIIIKNNTNSYLLYNFILCSIFIIELFNQETLIEELHYI